MGPGCRLAVAGGGAGVPVGSGTRDPRPSRAEESASKGFACEQGARAVGDKEWPESIDYCWQAASAVRQSVLMGRAGK